MEADGEQRPRPHAQRRAAAAASLPPPPNFPFEWGKFPAGPDRATLPLPLLRLRVPPREHRVSPGHAEGSHSHVPRAALSPSSSSAAPGRTAPPRPVPLAARGVPLPGGGGGGRGRAWGMAPSPGPSCSQLRAAGGRADAAGRARCAQGAAWGDARPRADTRHVLLDCVASGNHRITGHPRAVRDSRRPSSPTAGSVQLHPKSKPWV